MVSFYSLNKTCITLVFVLLCCWGCVSPGSTGPESGTGKQDEAAVKSPVSPVKPGKVAGAERLEEVLIKDEKDRTVIRVSASNPLQDYEFRRSSENRFELNLGDIKPDGPQPSLPVGSDRVKLSYADQKASPGVQIVGTHSNHLDHYVMNRVENALVVALYFTKESTPKAKGPSRAPAEATVTKAKPVEEKPLIEARREIPDVPAPKAPKAAVVARRTPAQDPVTVVPSPQIGGPKVYKEKPISLDLLDADLKNVLRLIADITGTNIVIEPDVTGKVTLKVEQVPWDQVLDMVLSMNDLGMEKVGNVIRVAKEDRLRKAIDKKVEAIEAQQKLIAATEAAKELGELKTVFLSVNYAKPAEIANKINEIKSERGKAIVDERTSLIIFTDYPARLEAGRQLLTRLDKPTPQVLIEARIVTMNTQTARDLGIRWNFSTSNSSFAQAFEINHPATGALDFYTFGVGGLIGKTMWNLNAELSALESSSDVKIIAAPKVMTLNNVKATVSQGTQIPYAQPSTVGGVGVATSTIFKDAVIQLDVTPHVTPDKRVRMQIEAKQDTPGTTTYTGGVGIDTRKVTTELLVDDGNIVVIGGVLSDTTSINKDMTPGLHKVPILGRLFKREAESTNRQELLIFISPKIVEAQRTPG